MNRVELVGRLSCHPTSRYAGDICVSRFNLAVDRRVKKDGQQDADFINIVTFSKTAEFAVKYLRKGMKVAVAGRIHTDSYDNKDGQKVYTTEVVAESIEFCEKKELAGEEASSEAAADDGFMNVPEGVDAELPFR